MNVNDLSNLADTWKMTLEYAPQHVQQVRYAIIDIVDGMLLREAESVELKRHFSDEEIDYILVGRKLPAIKAVKNRLGLSLIEAKKYVETHGGQILIEAVERRRYTS